jgi:hypothetical protein
LKTGDRRGRQRKQARPNKRKRKVLGEVLKEIWRAVRVKPQDERLPTVIMSGGNQPEPVSALTER